MKWKIKKLTKCLSKWVERPEREREEREMGVVAGVNDLMRLEEEEKKHVAVSQQQQQQFSSIGNN